MKQLGAFLALIALLSLVPAAFAVDGGGSVYRSGARSLMGRAASDVPPCSDDRFLDCGDAMRDKTFAADGGGPVYRSGARSPVGRAASNVPPCSDDRFLDCGDAMRDKTFAADGGVLAYQPGAMSPMGSTTSNTPHSDDQVWHAGDLRPSGLYMGLDGVFHNVPKTQDPRLRIY